MFNTISANSYCDVHANVIVGSVTEENVTVGSVTVGNDTVGNDAVANVTVGNDIVGMLQKCHSRK